MLTAYDATVARLMDDHVDAVLVGDSLGMGMLGQMLGSVIPSKIEVPLPMPGMGINILPSLRPSNSNLLINGNFDTPLLNGALFHQSTFRDLFGLTGLSFTAGLRLDYEKMKRSEDGAHRTVALPRFHRQGLPATVAEVCPSI